MTDGQGQSNTGCLGWKGTRSPFPSFFSPFPLSLGPSLSVYPAYSLKLFPPFLPPPSFSLSSPLILPLSLSQALFYDSTHPALWVLPAAFPRQSQHLHCTTNCLYSTELHSDKLYFSCLTSPAGESLLWLHRLIHRPTLPLSALTAVQCNYPSHGCPLCTLDSVCLLSLLTRFHGLSNVSRPVASTLIHSFTRQRPRIQSGSDRRHRHDSRIKDSPCSRATHV